LVSRRPQRFKAPESGSTFPDVISDAGRIAVCAVLGARLAAGVADGALADAVHLGAHHGVVRLGWAPNVGRAPKWSSHHSSTSRSAATPIPKLGVFLSIPRWTSPKKCRGSRLFHLGGREPPQVCSSLRIPSDRRALLPVLVTVGADAPRVDVPDVLGRPAELVVAGSPPRTLAEGCSVSAGDAIVQLVEFAGHRTH